MTIVEGILLRKRVVGKCFLFNEDNWEYRDNTLTEFKNKANMEKENVMFKN